MARIMRSSAARCSRWMQDERIHERHSGRQRRRPSTWHPTEAANGRSTLKPWRGLTLPSRLPSLHSSFFHHTLTCIHPRHQRHRTTHICTTITPTCTCMRCIKGNRCGGNPYQARRRHSQTAKTALASQCQHAAAVGISRRLDPSRTVCSSMAELMICAGNYCLGYFRRNHTARTTCIRKQSLLSTRNTNKSRMRSTSDQ